MSDDIMDVLENSVEELEHLRVPVEKKTPYHCTKTPKYASIQHMLKNYKCVGFSNGRIVDEDAGSNTYSAVGVRAFTGNKNGLGEGLEADRRIPKSNSLEQIIGFMTRDAVKKAHRDWLWRRKTAEHTGNPRHLLKLSEDDAYEYYQKPTPRILNPTPEVDRSLHNWTRLIGNWQGIKRADAFIDLFRISRRFADTDGRRIIDHKVLKQIKIKITYKSSSQGYDTYSYRLVFDSWKGAGEKLDTAFKLAARYVHKMRNARKLPTGRYTVILSPRATGVLMHEALVHLGCADHMRSGWTTYYNSSKGKQLFPRDITVTDNPLAKGAGQFRFDSEGIQAEPVDIVLKGVFNDYLRSRTSGFGKSNGHARQQWPIDGSDPLPYIARTSNLITTSSSALPPELFLKRAFEIHEQEGTDGIVYIDGHAGLSEIIKGPLQVYPNIGYLIEGSDKRYVNRFTLVGDPMTLAGEIRAASQTRGTDYGYCGDDSGYVTIQNESPMLILGKALCVQETPEMAMYEDQFGQERPQSKGFHIF